MYKPHNSNTMKNTILIFIATVFFIGGPIHLANWQIEYSRQHSSPIKMVKNIPLYDGVYAMKILAAPGTHPYKRCQNEKRVISFLAAAAGSESQ